MEESGVELVWKGKALPAFPPSEFSCYRLEECYPGRDEAYVAAESSPRLQPKTREPKSEDSIYLEDKDKPLNRIYVGENLTVLGTIHADLAGKIDCVYIDPPFNSQSDYSQKILFHGSNPKNLTLKQYGDKWDESKYLQFMLERFVALREMLAESGSIFIHCDWHAAASLRLVCDEVFGAGNLLNEIVWFYASGGGSHRRFGRKHDTILFYARDARKHFFNADEVRVPYRSTIAAKRRELFNPHGMVAPDVWEISRPPNHSRTWVGYPTQKPLEVIERALRAACPPGGLVMDCFSGSGSTLVAAANLGMNFIGVEQNPLGVHLSRKRLVKAGVPFGVWRSSDSKPVGSRVIGAEKLPEVEMLDWVAIDPDYSIGAGQVFTPTLFDMPLREELVEFPTAVNRGVALVTDVTGQDHFVRLEA